MSARAWLVLALTLLSGMASASEIDTLLERAQHGDVSALKALRMRLAESPGSAAQVQQVVEGYRDASVKGDARAQFEYGYLLEQGLGVDRDYRQAESWYRKAAEQGHVEAQYRLGRMYHEGAATPSDRRQAFVWLSVAARAGSKPAATLLERAEATLAPGDLDKARAEAETLIARLHPAASPP